MINNTASKGQESSERKPALGPSFALMTDTTLWLQRNQNTEDDDSTVHSISVLRSRSIVCMTLILLVSLTDLITPAHLRSGPVSNSQQRTLPRMSLTFLRLTLHSVTALYFALLIWRYDNACTPLLKELETSCQLWELLWAHGNVHINYSTTAVGNVGSTSSPCICIRHLIIENQSQNRVISTLIIRKDSSRVRFPSNNHVHTGKAF